MGAPDDRLLQRDAVTVPYGIAGVLFIIAAGVEAFVVKVGWRWWCWWWW